MTHAEVRALLGDYLEGDLALARRALVDAHLDACLDCAGRVRELRSTVDALHSLGEPELPSGLADAVLRRIEAGEGQPRLLPRLLSRIPWTIRSRLAVPAVAAVSVAVLFLWLRPATDAPGPLVPTPDLSQAMEPGAPIGASVTPETGAAAEEALVPTGATALQRSLADPGWAVRSAGSLAEPARGKWVASLVQQAGDPADVLALVRALRALPDPHADRLADELEAGAKRSVQR